MWQIVAAASFCSPNPMGWASWIISVQFHGKEEVVTENNASPSTADPAQILRQNAPARAHLNLARPRMTAVMTVAGTMLFWLGFFTWLFR